MDSRTIRILEFDGGGERGVLSLQFFIRFIQQWGINPSDIWKYFDVICGTSVGGMIALALAFGLTPTTMLSILTVQGPYIFSLTSVTPSVRPNLAAKLALILTNTPFYQSSGLTANSYGSGLLKTTLETTFGASTLQGLKTNVVIPTYKEDTSTYTLCSNRNFSNFVGQNELISNVALATGSAPIYLPPLILADDSPGKLNGTYIDGGIYQNNPAQFGINLAKSLKPTANRVCVLSIGTGLGEMGFDEGNPSMMDSRVEPMMMEMAQSSISFDSVKKIFGLFDIAATGGQESVAQNLYMESVHNLEQFYYYRFQPKLDLTLNTELDNTDPGILTYYNTIAENIFNNDVVNIATFIGHLTA